MAHKQFLFRQGDSEELELFPYIKELGLRKNTTIQLDSFVLNRVEDLQIYCILEGKFEWTINQQHHVLYPGDTVIVLPGQQIGGSKGYLEIGSFIWLHLQVGKVVPDNRMSLGSWSHISTNDSHTIRKILFFNKLPILKIKEVAGILDEMRSEIVDQEIGYITRVNHMLDTLLILISRHSTRHSNSLNDFPKAFLKIEQELRQNLAHQWTVEEMSAMVGLGTTAFTEKVKSHTGFPPLHYLINIRISEAIKLLKRKKVSITDVALETGFYSSQHFSTTFKKLTGYTPNEFRKKNLSH